jgi:hypothetical protein
MRQGFCDLKEVYLSRNTQISQKLVKQNPGLDFHDRFHPTVWAVRVWNLIERVQSLSQGIEGYNYRGWSITE